MVIVANIIRSNSMVRSLKVSIDYDGSDALTTAQTLEKSILTAMPTLTSLKVKEVDTKAIREQVLTSQYILNCNAYVSILGNIVVKAYQRKPLLHVYYYSKEFYIDNTGQRLSLSKEGKSHVMVANGHFKQRDTVVNAIPNFHAAETDSLRMNYDIVKMWQLAHFLETKKYLPMFDQIYIDKHGDLFVTPKLGTHVVNVGDIDDLDTKFKHLMALYNQALPRVGWDRYSLVTLKFKDQVVCRKS